MTADLCRTPMAVMRRRVVFPNTSGPSMRSPGTQPRSRVVLAVERDGSRGEREDAWSISWDSWKRIERAKGAVA